MGLTLRLERSVPWGRVRGAACSREAPFASWQEGKKGRVVWSKGGGTPKIPPQRGSLGRGRPLPAVCAVRWLSLTVLGPLFPAGGPVAPTLGPGETHDGALLPQPRPLPSRWVGGWSAQPTWPEGPQPPGEGGGGQAPGASTLPVHRPVRLLPAAASSSFGADPPPPGPKHL